MYLHPQISTSVAYRQTLLLAFEKMYNDTLSALTRHHRASSLNPSLGIFSLLALAFLQMDTRKIRDM